MRFVHDDEEFDDLLQIVAEGKRLGIGLVEKDYWVTHTLWALHEQGFEVWFKGGTSLSKGFGIIERFSEDLDLKIEPGRVMSLPAVTSWKSDGRKATGQRKEYFEVLARELRIPGATVKLNDIIDPYFRSANLQVDYPGLHHASLATVMRPFVLLEFGSARVTPFVPRDMSSFVHDHLQFTGQLAGYRDNRPRGVRCVHPLVTLVEKLDALMRRFPREAVAPATFVRHFEDAAWIIRARDSIAPLGAYEDVAALAAEMLTQRQIAKLPTTLDEAFNPTETNRWHAVRHAHEAMGPMYWGARLSLDEACSEIRDWIGSEIGGG